MPDVVVHRLRMHAPRCEGPAADPRASALALDLALPFPGRQVLIVRRLAVPGGDRVAARERLDTLARQAAHPASGPVDPHAEAVLFADEAQALLCLTRDVVNARSGRWYWAGRLPAHTAAPGEVLGWLWARQPRWVPAVLSALARDEPEVAARALRALPPGAGELVSSEVAREYAVSAPVPAMVGTPSPEAAERGNAIPGQEWLTRPGGGSRSSGRGCRAPSPGDRLTAATPRLPGAPASEMSDMSDMSDMLLPASARQLLELSVSLVPGPVPSLLAAAPRAGASLPTAEPFPRADTQPADPLSGPLPNRPTTATPPATGLRSNEGAVPAGSGGAAAPASDDPTRRVAVGARREVDPATQPGHGARPCSERARTTPSSVASAAYAITLMQRTGAFPLAAARGESGWTAVEAAVRWLLLRLPGRQPRAALRDPLLRVLAELDGRLPGSPPPSPPAPATRRRMLALLSAHRVPRTAFAEAGTVHVSRTHVDIVLPINTIDLAVRAAGLDQDPGWVPDLGRVVLVHFEGGG